MNDSQPPRRWWLRRWLNRIEMDRAVFYVVLGRAWQFLAGPVTMLLIANRFTPEEQGYYYTFWQLLALQLFVELGFSTVVVYAASHEWSRLQLDAAGAVVGDAGALRRLASLHRYFQRWFNAASLAFAVAVGAAGLLFFSSSRPDDGWFWVGPWLALVALTAVSLRQAPRIALLEGCNQVAVVNRNYTLQAICGNFAVWAALLAGAGLWVTVVAACVRLAWELWLTAVRYRRLFDSLPADSGNEHWRQELRPLQLRIGGQTMVRYFALNLLTPVVFYYRGPALAGQTGMTWTLLTSVLVASYAWVHTRAPRFGMYVAQRDFEQLDRVFFRLTWIATAIMSLACPLVCVGVAVLHRLPWSIAERLADRMLPPLETAVFGVALTLTLVTQCFALYLHAHKQAPLFRLNVLANLLMGGLVWLLGGLYGPLWAGVGLVAVSALLHLPGTVLIWRHCRRQWHQP